MVFLPHKGKKNRCRVRLCGKREKDRRSSVYLHELHRIKCKTAADEGGDPRKADRFGAEALTPEMSVSADDGLDIVFVDGRVLLADSVAVRAVFVSTDDGMLVRKGYPVVRDEGGK